MENEESPVIDGSFGTAESQEGSPTFKAEESLKNWRNGDKVDTNNSVVAGDQNEADASPKKDEAEASEKKSSKVEDTIEKDSKESDSGDETDDAGEDGDNDVDDSDSDGSEDDNVDSSDSDVEPTNNEPEQPAQRPDQALEDRLEKLESMLQQSQDRLNEKEYAESIKKDFELTKNPYSFSMDFNSVTDALSEEALDYFNDDPEAAQYQSELISQAMNKFMNDFQSYSEAQNRVGEYKDIQAREEKAKVNKELSKRGLDLGVFKTEGFSQFEQDPRNAKMLDGLYDRFKGNDVEYAHHVYDEYQKHLKSSKSKKAKAVNEKASNSRKNINSRQKQADSSRPVGSNKQPLQSNKPFNVAESLSAFRKSQG